MISLYQDLDFSVAIYTQVVSIPFSFRRMIRVCICNILNVRSHF
ncbi:hypothetical protein MC7420_4801 [Coleofasciculus chthonoplastes PCC 7420]|uniref:Uncharacterized protein n=1 Tax=Coleofasciculus chthonoplastes PCC 7420 TaxID=118168 RepID=B4VNY6_9CYAN|nr:hypothetical protein [Coleofasciculus chthonoplastes]EDX76545.1 hypothetical protein MC7420_4801 [Coleofasciculus chthonoplastes PCC 7420]